jgi:hypothetical protein
MEYGVVMQSKINDIIGTDDLLEDEKKKLERQAWLRSQIDFTVMVRTKEDEKWQDFTGLFLMREGWNEDKVIEHIQQSFSTDQFRVYTFGLFKRYYDETNNMKYSNNYFKFDFLCEIELLEENISWLNDEEEDIC